MGCCTEKLATACHDLARRATPELEAQFLGFLSETHPISLQKPQF